ncbi:hypothetical protein DH2020_029648 [Rehmannia glutinosa]|uniref:CCHC-type domain-containing protein n=1 Tax=Rehmannia glutinosa TaxID=99300 RepID=A0ABR0VS32_REHGL
MEQDIVDRIKNFTLTTDEKEEIALEEKDVSKSKAECARSLLGKSFGSKKINFAGLRNTLLNIWQTRDPLTVREIGNNLFQFIFQNQEDKNRVLKGKTWTFDNQYLLLREWSEDILEKVESINTVELWVQIWNLPFHWISLDTGRKIGKKFSFVSDVNIPDAGNIKGMHIRILADINLDKPLLRGTNIKLGEETHWLDFRYENLQGFCFYCGLVGHSEKGCQSRREDLRKNDFKEDQFGDWLRAQESSPFRQLNRASRFTTGNNSNLSSIDRSTNTVLSDIPGQENKGINEDNLSGKEGLDMVSCPRVDVPHISCGDQDKENIIPFSCLPEAPSPTQPSPLVLIYCNEMGKRVSIPLKESTNELVLTNNNQRKNEGQGKRYSKRVGKKIGEAIPMEIYGNFEAYSSCQKRPFNMLQEDIDQQSGELKKRKTGGDVKQDRLHFSVFLLWILWKARNQWIFQKYGGLVMIFILEQKLNGKSSVSLSKAPPVLVLYPAPSMSILLIILSSPPQ